MKKVLTIILLFSMVIFIFTGCRCAAEKITEKAIERAAAAEGQDVDIDTDEDKVSITGEDGETVEIDSDSGETTIKTEEGEVTYSEGGNELPEGFPNVVPVYPDLNIVSSSSFKEEGSQAYTVMGSYTGNGEDVFNWYKDQLASWDIESEQSTDLGEEGLFYTINASSGNYTLNVTVTESEGENAVLLNVEQK
ncbi:MAG: hypothetical protein ACQEP2_00145 [Actinomycetota bacterium]